MLQRLWLPLLAFVALGSVPNAAFPATPPIVAGFQRFYDSENGNQAQGGSLLLSELNCVACHQPTDASTIRKQAPVLDQVGSRVRIDHLRRFLADPHTVKPGTTMPHLLANDPEQANKVEALVHFLAQTGSVKQERFDRRNVGPGQDLYSKVGCVACHGPRDGLGQAEKNLPSTAVPLGDLKTKYSVASLTSFLENPHQARPSGRMPKILNTDEARKVATYLLQGIQVSVLPSGPGSTQYFYYEGEWDKLPDFTKHKPVATGTGTAFDLSAARRGNNYALVFDGVLKVETSGKYTFELTSDDGSRLLVGGKKVVDNDGIHPPQTSRGEIELKKGFYKVQVQFFQGGGGAELAVQVDGPGLGMQPLAPLMSAKMPQPGTPAPAPVVNKNDPDQIQINPELAAKGESLFASLGCASCHALKKDNASIASTRKATALDKLMPQGGCLAEKPAAGLPVYDLSERQRADLTAAIKTPVVAAREPAAVIDQTMTVFNCYACHVRDKKGGIQEELNKHFTTQQPEMGEEGRVPPLLDLVGAKLNLDYYKNILDKGVHDRPYMNTRMPGFGLDNVGAFVTATTAIDKMDAGTPVTFSDPVSRVKAAGRFFVSGQAVGCVKCHTFKGVKAEGVQGIDMAIMTKRVKHDWFQAYVSDPQKIRPGTRMPQSWPAGNTFYPNVLDGKALTQIESLWVYLSDGNNAQLPPGIGKRSIPLVATKSAVLYRNFIKDAGSRAIGVGYPEHVNLAFDANELRLALLWQGAFIDAALHWTDRGAGYEGPLGDNVLNFPSGPTFAVLNDSSTPWPKGYAREQGWRFGGYSLTEDDRPTFKYSLDDIKIEDFPNPPGNKDMTLKRTFTLSATKPHENLYLRAASGSKIEALEKGWYKIDNLKLKIEGGTPSIRNVGGTSELIVPVSFKDGKAQLVLEYLW